MYLGVGEDNTGPRCVLDGELRLAVLALLVVRGMDREEGLDSQQ